MSGSVRSVLQVHVTAQTAVTPWLHHASEPRTPSTRFGLGSGLTRAPSTSRKLLAHGTADSPPPAAECQPSPTHFPKGPKPWKAVFCRFTVSLAYITRSGGGWRRSQEYTAS